MAKAQKCSSSRYARKAARATDELRRNTTAKTTKGGGARNDSKQKDTLKLKPCFISSQFPEPSAPTDEMSHSKIKGNIVLPKTAIAQRLNEVGGGGCCILIMSQTTSVDLRKFSSRQSRESDLSGMACIYPSILPLCPFVLSSPCLRIPLYLFVQYFLSDCVSHRLEGSVGRVHRRRWRSALPETRNDNKRKNGGRNNQDKTKTKQMRDGWEKRGAIFLK